MRRLKNAPAVALENEGVDDVNLDNSDSLETELIDIGDTQIDTDVMEASIADAANTADELEAIAANVQDTLAEDGEGIPAASAEVVTVAVEGLYNRLGFQVKGVAALEDFKTSADRKAATKVALESVVETIKKIWERIINAIKTAWTWVKENLLKIFGAAERLVRRAEKLEKKNTEGKENLTTKLASIGELTFGDGQLGFSESKIVTKAPQMFKSLHVNGNMTHLADHLAAMTKDGQWLFGEVANAGVEAASDCVKKFKDMKDAFPENFRTSPTGCPLTEHLPDADQYGFENVPEGLGVYRGKELPGGKTLLFIGATKELSGAAGFETYLKSSVTIQDFHPSEPKIDLHVPVPNRAEINKILGEVKKIGQALQAFRTSEAKLDKAKSDLLAAAKDEQKKEGGNDKARAIRFCAKRLDYPMVPYAIYMLTVGKHTLDYASKVIQLRYGSNVARVHT